MKGTVYLALAIMVVLTSSLDVTASTAFLCTNVTEIPQTECEALVALYNSTNGPGWTIHTNWLVTNTPSNWFGVYLTSTQPVSSVVQLDFLGNQLSGSIPPELGNLTNLERLSLGINQLSGSIPPELGKLANLWQLDLSNNQ